MTDAQRAACGLADYPRAVADEKWLDGWSRIPNCILARSDISPRAKVAYMVLLDQARYHARRRNQGLNGAWLGCRQLAVRAGMKVTFFRGAVAQLVAVGLLSPSAPECGASVEFEVSDPSAEVRSDQSAPPRSDQSAPPRSDQSAPPRSDQSAPHLEEREELQKNEKPNLLPESLSFRSYLKQELRVHWTERQIRFIEPAFRAGVRLSIAKALAPEHILNDKPWDFCTRLLGAWARWREIVGRCVRVYLLGEHGRVSQEEWDSVKPDMTEEELEWLAAKDPAEPIPASLREALGSEIAALCDAATDAEIAADGPAQPVEVTLQRRWREGRN